MMKKKLSRYLGILNLKRKNEKKYDTIQLLMWLLFLYRVSQSKLLQDQQPV